MAIQPASASLVRIPAACCAIAGLKTTWGRVPVDGVYPLAPSLDTVGPPGGEEQLVALGRVIEAALRR